MRNVFAFIPAALLVTALCAGPAAADPGRGKGHGRNHDASSRQVADCPPGLAKKNPSCVPPGQARKHEVRHGHRVGEILRIGDYALIRDPRRFHLDTRPDWRYYRDENNIYRVDGDTRRILAVLNLIDAFTN